MAIVPTMTPPESAAPGTVPSAEGITVQMNNISIEPSNPLKPVTGTSVRISVPLDATSRTAVATSRVYTERKIFRRDSIERREALLKGKEGSRQRRRWENGNQPSYQGWLRSG
jgi:hypothetical protein